MPNENRGKIINEDRAKQLRDFGGLLFGNITPTDIDGLIEYHNKAYVIMEFKHRDNEIPDGQRKALERMNDDFEQMGKRSICIIARHCQDDCNEPIDAANAIVTEFREKRNWVVIVNNSTLVKNFITDFLNQIDKPQTRKPTTKLPPNTNWNTYDTIL
jgi:hypothetical protein